MPLYEYQCEKCGERFEVIEKFSDEPLTVHQKCGGAVHRLISAPALQFKGSGWYITDYAKAQSGSGSENGAPAKPDSATAKTGSEASGSTPAANTGSETKPASETKTKSGSESKPGSTKTKSDTK